MLWIAENKGESQLDKIEDNPCNWRKMELRNFESNINRVAWSLDGETLGVSTSDGLSYVFKEESENEWILISETNSEGIIGNNQ